MARFEFKLPDIGEGVAEGEIVSWHVAPGQDVTEDDPMVEVMTDKATVTIAAPKTGRVLETRAKVGQVVPVHSVLVVLELGESADEAQDGATTNSVDGGRSTAVTPTSASHRPAPRAVANGASNGEAENVASAVGDIREDLPGMRHADAQLADAARAAAAVPKPSYWNEKPLATPATRKLARDIGVELRSVRPTGPFGRTSSDDVRARAASRAASAAPSPALSHASPPPAAAHVATLRAGLADEKGDLRAPLQGVRRRIFENMSRSKQTAAHFTFVEECDAGPLKSLRERLKPAAALHGIKLTFLPFIIKAAVLALKRHPALNAMFDEGSQEIVTRGEYNIGIATATDNGLVVPVVHGADRLSLLAIAHELERLASDARANHLRLSDLQGGTFTITSLGQKSGLLATPIIHFPQVAILGVHQIKRKPVVRDDAIVIGDVMLLSLSFDHRLIDGHVGAAFAYELIAILEQPETLFLDAV